MRTSHVAVLALTMFVASCRDAVPPTQPLASSPAFASASDQDRPVYIVTFRDDAPNATGLAQQIARANGSSPIYTYTRVIRGFAAPFSPQAAEALLNNPNVESVELDQVVTADATQTGATWGLDRIDQRSLPLNSTYVYDATGSGVTAYIIDTGIRTSHTEFGGRASGGYTAISDGNGTTDCNGHGTHVAGTVGGSTYGVAKAVSLVAVRVLGCNGSGTTAGVIAGIDWVAANASGPSVANMSLGGGASTSLDNAVANAVTQGITMVVAAGNDNRNACNYSPARAPSAITVGATTSSDARASYSNYGTCLDLFAPGSSITSSYYSSNTATATMSGTSMASPHVAGVAALYLGANPTASPAAVTSAIVAAATSGAVASAGSGSPNRLLYSGFIGGGAPPPNQAPTARFSYSCTYLACSFDGSASSDPDGTIQGHAWTFGDGSSGSGATASRTYGSAGTFTVTLTVTDNAGATNSTSQSVTVQAPPPASIELSASTSAKGKNNFVELSWTGATTGVDIYRDGGNTPIATVSGTSWQQNVGKGSGSATYRVCSGGVCSNTTTVSW